MGMGRLMETQKNPEQDDHEGKRPTLRVTILILLAPLTIYYGWQLFSAVSKRVKVVDGVTDVVRMQTALNGDLAIYRQGTPSPMLVDMIGPAGAAELHNNLFVVEASSLSNPDCQLVFAEWPFLDGCNGPFLEKIELGNVICASTYAPRVSVVERARSAQSQYTFSTSDTLSGRDSSDISPACLITGWSRSKDQWHLATIHLSLPTPTGGWTDYKPEVEIWRADDGSD